MPDSGASPAKRLLTIFRLLLAAALVSSVGLLLAGGSLGFLNLFWGVLSLVLLAGLWRVFELYRQLPECEPVALAPQAQEGRFLSSMGHDLRQPAQAISLFAATLSAHPLQDSSRKLVTGIESAVQQLSAQMEAVFSIAKLEAGQFELKPAAVVLDSVFARVVSNHLDDAHERQLHLRHVPTSRQAHSDITLLTQAVDRMVAHAVAIAGEGGVVLGCRQRGGAVLIEVWNSGEGISAELLPQVFQAGSIYGQNLLDRGLGLVQARKIAEILGGQLTLSSRTGKGCVLRLALPAA